MGAATTAPPSAQSVAVADSLPPAAAEQRSATLALLLICAAVVVLHVGLVGLDRPIHWDESIHVSQVNPERPAVFMEPHRTRGVSLLVAPVAVFDPSMVVLRAYLVLAAMAGTFFAFRTWIPTVGWAAPIAAGLYSIHWVTLFYLVEALPNHPATLLAVAAAGLVARSATGAELPLRGWELAVLFGLFALVRPPDAVIVGVGLGVVLLLLRGRRAFPVLARAVAGGVAGLVPWLVEGAVRFGFWPLATVRSAGQYSVGSERFNQLPLYLRALEDQLRCGRGCIARYLEERGSWELPPARTMTFLVVATALAVLATVVARHRPAGIVVPIAAAVPVVLFYGFSGGAMNLRYMMPAFALLLVLPAIGLRHVWVRLPRWWPQGALPVRVFIVLLLAATAWWQAGTAIERLVVESTRHRAQELGMAVGEAADGSPCVVATEVDYPQIQYWSRCLATVAGDFEETLQPPLGELGSYVDLAAHAEAGARVFAVGPEAPPEGSFLADWRMAFPELIRGFRIYEHEPGAPLPPAPCPPEDEGPERLLAEVLSDSC